MQKNSINETLNNWLKINRSIARLSIASLIQGIANIVLLIFAIMLYSKSPIVVLTDGKDARFYQSQKAEIKISEGVIKRHIEKFIYQRYKWDKLDVKKISKSLSYLTTKGFNKRVQLELKKLRAELKGHLSQDITDIKVIVTDKDTVASFDRVLRVNGVPLLIPTQMSFKIVKGDRHSLNPSGLEINGITIHEVQR